MTMTTALSAAGIIGQSSAAPEHTYTYLACDLMTDVVLAELPLQQVTYETVLSGIGTLRAFLPLNDETNQLGVLNATTGGRTTLYVDRDGVIVWAGIIWTRQDTAGGVTIQAAELLSYYQHRYVAQTLSTETANVTATAYVPDGQRLYSDQKFLVWSLLRYADAQGHTPPLDLNWLASSGADGIARQATYYGYERPEIYATIAQLSQADDGFDFGIEVGWNPVLNGQPPTRYRTAKTWSPKRGRSADDSGLVFAKGGTAASIVAYDWPEDWTALATRTHALGDGDGEARLIASASDTDLLASGWPLLEYVGTYQGVTQQATIQGHANADMNARSSAANSPTFTVLADGDPSLGSYTVGDSALFSIAPEPRFPAGVEQEFRILGIAVTAASGPELAKLTCGAM
jgi:hypothetical protein